MIQLDLVPTPVAPARAGIRLIHGDVVESIALAKGVGFIQADPPWQMQGSRYSAGRRGLNGGVQYECLTMDQIGEHIDAAWGVARDDCYLALWITWPVLVEWLGPDGPRTRWQYVSGGAWTKHHGVDHPSSPGVGFHWRGDSEPLLLYRKGRPKPRCLVRNAKVSPRNRHSEKPEPWLADIVRAFSDPGDEILDLYAGMAPLARACLSTGRRYLGAEIDETRHRDAMGLIAQWRGGSDG